MSNHSIFKTLYWAYKENNHGDPPAIKQLFQQLDHKLSSLASNEIDSITSIVCELCIQHEYRAYQAGFCNAIDFLSELEKTE